MNRPTFNIDKINPYSPYCNKIYSRLTRMEAKHYGPQCQIISEKDYRVERFLVNKERIGEFFRENNVTHIYINEALEKKEDAGYKFGPFAVIDKTNVIINCIIS